MTRRGRALALVLALAAALGAAIPTQAPPIPLPSSMAAARPGHLYLSSLPNIYQLWAVLHTNPVAVTTWSTFNICQSMLSTSNTEADRQLVVAQEQADNQVLAAECAKAVSFGRDCRWDN